MRIKPMFVVSWFSTSLVDALLANVVAVSIMQATIAELLIWSLRFLSTVSLAYAAASHECTGQWSNGCGFGCIWITGV